MAGTSLKIYFYLFIIIAGLFSSCNSGKLIQKRNGYLLTKNSIVNPEPYLDNDEIDGFILQKPTKGNLSFFHPGIRYYEWLSEGKQTKFKNYLKRTFGIQPVIFDSALAARSLDDIVRYMNNKGFYHAAAEFTVIKKKAKVSVKYILDPGIPYRIRNFNYSSEDTLILAKVFKDASNSIPAGGRIYDIEALDDERDRITRYLKTQGYLTFIKNYITYIADSTVGEQQVDITLIINKKQIRTSAGDLTTESNHPVYELKNIYIVPDGEIKSNPDTVQYHYAGRRDTADFQLIGQNQLRIKPAVFRNNLFFRSGDDYNQQKLNSSYRRLMNLSIIQSAAISFRMPDENTMPVNGKLPVDYVIRISHNRVNSFSIGAEGTNSGGNLGMGANVLYQNRNIFRGAEVFRVKFNGGVEVQGNVQTTSQQKRLWVFNTLEYGAEAALDFPRMLAPFNIATAEQVSATTTTLSSGYAYETRPDFTRTVTNISMSYKWNSNERVKHIFSPLELNFVNISTDSAFNAYLQSLSDPLFLSQYSNHLLSMMRYSFIYTQPGQRKLKESLFFRINAESSGNLFFAFDKISGREPLNEGYYTYFNVRYSQFVRTDADIRFYWPVRQKSSIAIRFMGGIGIPYGNSDALPFEKAFWLGGANDMRAWKLRSLGPGGYKSDSLQFGKTGDLMILGSLEYRYPIYKYIYGAAFFDAGNVWLLKANDNFPGGEFKPANLIKDIALGAGGGIRFDFSFFILRIDWALRIKNPAHTDQWFHPDDFRLQSGVWNLGIGMPF